jgi:N-methylhydantoinase B/oxoprolinase/acetone carboxylase alpha subunit
VYYETIGGGQGGRPDGQRGMSGVHTGMTNTRNTPIEALERAYPLRVRRSTLRRGTGGRGAAPGGDGIDREVELLVDATASLITERRTSDPWPVGDGGPGARGEDAVVAASESEPVDDKFTLQLRAGDALIVKTPGGGGWTDPTP